MEFKSQWDSRKSGINGMAYDLSREFPIMISKRLEQNGIKMFYYENGKEEIDLKCRYPLISAGKVYGVSESNSVSRDIGVTFASSISADNDVTLSSLKAQCDWYDHMRFSMAKEFVESIMNIAIPLYTEGCDEVNVYCQERMKIHSFPQGYREIIHVEGHFQIISPIVDDSFIADYFAGLTQAPRENVLDMMADLIIEQAGDTYGYSR